MPEPVPRDVLRKVRKLAELPREARRCRFAVSVTRLTVLKSLCRDPAVANRFVTYLARKTLERVARGKGRSSRRKGATDLAHRRMMSEALAGMEAWLHEPAEELRAELLGLLGRMRDEQNEYKNIAWGAVRLITDWELLLFEYALQCLLHPPYEASHWAYQTAKHYAERYDPSHGTGLTPASGSLVQDIVDFWMGHFGLTPESLTAPAKPVKPKAGKSSVKSRKAAAGKRRIRFTHRQGQFLAFIHLYWQLHRRGPAELDLVKYFRVTPPSVHGMIVKLEQLGLVTREPGVPRSVRVALPEQDIPRLEETKEPAS
jgi:hypothetical protein